MRYSLQEILSKCKNGEERYKRSAIFRQCIDTLVRGGDPVDIIDQLTESHDKLVEESTKLVLHSPTPIHLQEPFLNACHCAPSVKLQKADGTCNNCHRPILRRT